MNYPSRYFNIEINVSDVHQTLKVRFRTLTILDRSHKTLIVLRNHYSNLRVIDFNIDKCDNSYQSDNKIMFLIRNLLNSRRMNIPF